MGFKHIRQEPVSHQRVADLTYELIDKKGEFSRQDRGFGKDGGFANIIQPGEISAHPHMILVKYWWFHPHLEVFTWNFRADFAGLQAGRSHSEVRSLLWGCAAKGAPWAEGVLTTTAEFSSFSFIPDHWRQTLIPVPTKCTSTNL